MSSPPGLSTPSDSDPNTPSVLGSSNGLATILVCLAAGLLIGVVVSVFALRRFYPRMRFLNRPSVGRQESEAKLGEKPRMWDVYVGNTAPLTGGQESGWQEMLPLSVSFISETTATYASVNTSSSLTPGVPRSQQGSSSPASRPFARFLMHLRYGAHSSDVDLQTALSLTDVREVSERGRLQVAVTVLMPSREVCMADGTREYCIGLAQVPWYKQDAERGPSALVEATA
ncbi:hypothetical protein AcW1_009681 [Taiwanofungus camphoratus]|nr:hypothetical protein AcV7_002530 [Antrodia cinnamomea]KAI0948079.1 hypothetical protein AcW1_009681 [Antrodia cinnamomea]